MMLMIVMMMMFDIANVKKPKKNQLVLIQDGLVVTMATVNTKGSTIGVLD